ncbi:MAG: pirin family protein [Candidatus Eremiobacteraeota bacterium]|nr:pirin family protein [Candidatus Eremiobacteraeota bacterium]
MSVQTNDAERSLDRVIPAAETLEGGGFLVHRPLPARAVEQIDPFLLLDEMGPMEHAPGTAEGAPDHPHKGFELITYLLEGEMEHLDSHGNHGVLRPGDAQYMLGGAGLVHSEMPTAAFQRSGGRRHGFQIWVNLAKSDKLLAPRYKDVPSATIPVVHPAEGVIARVLAGEAFGAIGPITTVTPWSYVHVTLAPGARVAEPVARGWTATAYVFGGVGHIGAREVRRGDYAIFADDGDVIALRNTGSEPLDALLLSARPIGEPMVRYGPFVMNTTDELQAAFDDFRAGRFGTIKPTVAD